jgi:hypothetical protein
MPPRTPNAEHRMPALSARQLANRANAQKSTGPTSAEGKARSSQNARKHGFLSSVLPHDATGWKSMLEGLYRSLRPANEMEQLIVDQIGIAYLRLSRLYVHECNIDRHAIVHNLLLPNLQHLQQPRGRGGHGFTPGGTPISAAAFARGAGYADAQACFFTAPNQDLTDGAAPPPKPRLFEDDRAHLRMRYETMLTRQISRSMALLEKLQKERMERERSNGRGAQEEPPFLPDFAGRREDAFLEETEEPADREEELHVQWQDDKEEVARDLVGQVSVPVRAATEAPTLPTPDGSQTAEGSIARSFNSSHGSNAASNRKPADRALLAQIRSERRQNTISREKAARRA